MPKGIPDPLRVLLSPLNRRARGLGRAAVRARRQMYAIAKQAKADRAARVTAVERRLEEIRAAGVPSIEALLETLRKATAQSGRPLQSGAVSDDGAEAGAGRIGPKSGDRSAEPGIDAAGTDVDEGAPKKARIDRPRKSGGVTIDAGQGDVGVRADPKPGDRSKKNIAAAAVDVDKGAPVP